MDELTVKKHDEKVFREGDAILNENDLRELINDVYADYQYAGAKFSKLAALINFLASEGNKYINPELVAESEQVINYLNNFRDFLQINFHAGKPAENSDAIFLFNTEETSAETEAFLIEFQVLSLDVEKAYRNYRAAVMSKLQR